MGYNGMCMNCWATKNPTKPARYMLIKYTHFLYYVLSPMIYDALLCPVFTFSVQEKTSFWHFYLCPTNRIGLKIN